MENLESIDPEAFIKKAKALVANDVNQNFPIDNLVSEAKPVDFYIVLFVKVLGNWKALVSTNHMSGYYWEVTYNGAKKESYVDRYEKATNRAVTDDEYADLS